MSRVAVIGLGAMGSRIAARLLAKGHQVVVWNRTPGKAVEVLAQGAALAKSPADAASDAEAVFTVIRDASALAEVTEGREGVVAGARSGTTVIEMSTVGPAAVARLRHVLRTDIGLIDAPVLGSVDEATSGSLRIYAGGPRDLVQRWDPLLSDLGAPLYTGPLGSGAAAKLVANAALLASVTALGETLVLAEGLGLARDVTFAVLSATPLAAQAERRRRGFEDDCYPARFALALAHKDAALIDAAATSTGVDARLLRAAQSWFADAARAGWLDRDYAAILAWITSSRAAPPASRPDASD